jgi:hypothetical protein
VRLCNLDHTVLGQNQVCRHRFFPHPRSELARTLPQARLVRPVSDLLARCAAAAAGCTRPRNRAGQRCVAPRLAPGGAAPGPRPPRSARAPLACGAGTAGSWRPPVWVQRSWLRAQGAWTRAQEKHSASKELQRLKQDCKEIAHRSPAAPAAPPAPPAPPTATSFPIPCLPSP